MAWSSGQARHSGLPVRGCADRYESCHCERCYQEGSDLYARHKRASEDDAPVRLVREHVPLHLATVLKHPRPRIPRDTRQSEQQHCRHLQRWPQTIL